MSFSHNCLSHKIVFPTKLSLSQNCLSHKIVFLAKLHFSQNCLSHKIVFLPKLSFSHNCRPHMIFSLTKLSFLTCVTDSTVKIIYNLHSWYEFSISKHPQATFRCRLQQFWTICKSVFLINMQQQLQLLWNETFETPLWAATSYSPPRQKIVHANEQSKCEVKI